MEWLGTSIDAGSIGGMTAEIEWLDPSAEFLQAVAMSALNHMPMPIPTDDVSNYTMNGYVTNYSWTHETDTSHAFGGSLTKRVRLSVKFMVVP